MNVEPTPNAIRRRRYRERRKEGSLAIFLITYEEIQNLVTRGFLKHSDRDDKAAVTRAAEAAFRKALRMNWNNP